MNIYRKQDNDSLVCRLKQLMDVEKLYTTPGVKRDMVAVALGTNRTYLCACIQETYGQTFPEYITSLRLNAAIKLLEENEGLIEIQVVADFVGFGTYSSFYRAFVNRYGIKPTDYVCFLEKKKILSK